MPDQDEWLPSVKNIEDYNLLTSMLQSQRKELDLLSGKKPNDLLNPMKIKMINRVLEPLKEVLQHEDSYKFLDVLNETDMPTNSDVVLIISQFETAVEEFKDKYYLHDKYQSNYLRTTNRWMTQEFPPEFYAPNDEEDVIEEE